MLPKPRIPACSALAPLRCPVPIRTGSPFPSSPPQSPNSATFSAAVSSAAPSTSTPMTCAAPSKLAPMLSMPCMQGRAVETNA
eukprot:365469-Chlamydomonas_euryale.AAC.2